MSTTDPILEELRVLMKDYVALYCKQSKPYHLDDVVVEGLRALRAEIRMEEGGGGMCHMVTEVISHHHDVERLWVSYLDRVGEVICAAHMICILQDGTILDPTADQFGEGHDVRILRPDDPEYGRYRPEFTQDYHPGHEDGTTVTGWAKFWSGRADDDRQDALTAERGEGWWLEDVSLLEAYFSEQAKVADGYYRPYLDRRIAGLTERSSTFQR